MVILSSLWGDIRTNWKRLLAHGVLLALCFQVFMMIALIVRFQALPNYVTGYDWIGNVAWIIQSTPSWKEGVFVERCCARAKTSWSGRMGGGCVCACACACASYTKPHGIPLLRCLATTRTIHTHTSTYTHTHTYVHTYIHTYVQHVHQHTYTRRRVHTHIFTYIRTVHKTIHTYTHTHIHTYTPTQIHACTRAHNTHTRIRAYTHAHIHAYINT